MKRLIPWAVILALNSSVAFAQAEGALEGSAVSTSNVSAATGKLSIGWKLIYCTVATHYRTGDSAVVSLTTDLTIPATIAWQVYISNQERYIAFILGSSTGSCSIYRQNPGPTGMPPQHASAGHIVTETGSITIGGGGTGTATVTAGTICVCSETTDETQTWKCALSGTTLTATDARPGDVINYICAT